jgi:hypothetical protein
MIKRFNKSVKYIQFLNPHGSLPLRGLWIALALSLLVCTQPPPASAAAPGDGNSAVTAAARKLIQFCADPRTGIDAQAAAAIVDYVLAPKSGREGSLAKLDECSGAYYEFDTRIAFPRFLSYSYNAQIPGALTRPSSMRYSMWSGLQGKSHFLNDKWKPLKTADEPVIIHGMQRDCITPDLNTGIYYEYDLKRTIIYLNHKGRQALISISKQAGQSDVGKKGLIIGSDNDWNYYYSGETGSFQTGLGWVKSYIYDYFSIGVYVEANGSSNIVRSGTFQWLRAGWSGINFVQSGHILTGMKRFARNSKSILESQHLPAPGQIARHYQLLCSLPSRDLFERYSALQQAQHSLAAQSGKIGSSDRKAQASYNNIPKEQIVQELMLEYLKLSLGKQSLIDRRLCSFSAPARSR